eukprot:CAMPEP_0181320120 /NCGR_PEP_ID=MMETSP1101-20121128/17947_1 /TAXON_ID=46948 /ORGANISM="Rhodomonas abbreviata, Strain Caron Lab Isolate" /LENGTH=783 /DNA_ID=CAMNT_0023427789 /DNA_START=132 /DNA_END=2483 /DNA_ORIENTATION=-
MSGQELSPEEQQERWLEEGKAVVKQQAFLMKRALDNSNLRDGLKYGSNMLCELRTGLLSPKNFYELYIMVADEMRHLEQYFFDEFKRGRRMVELYELVQHAGNIVPRLFLLISVGSVYVRSKEAPARDILKDLVEMCRGVQHPMRGLFLRSYLLQCARDKLPDVGSEFGEDVGDSVDFLMHNFAEMNKLWVRMQHQGPVRDRERREKERLDLRILVGTNLVRLSNLEGVDGPMYKALVLPRILEQVINCKDQIAQQYLMECIIQVFPDEFHLETLSDLLEATQQLQTAVDVKAILVALMRRLAAFATNDPSAIPADIDMLAVFHAHVSKLAESNLPLATFLDLQAELLKFSLGFAPNRLDVVDGLLAACGEALAAAQVTRLDGQAEQACVSLLTSPLHSNPNPLTILDLPHYAGLIGYLALDSRKEVAVLLTRLMRKTGTTLSEAAHMDSLLSFIQPLVKDAVEDEGQTPDEDDEDFEAEQGCVASLIHAVSNPDPAALFQVYFVARKHFGQGGSKRIKYTLPALVFRSLQLAVMLKEREQQEEEAPVSSKKVFAFALDTIKGLAGSEPALALRLFLQGAQAANRSREDKIAYEFVSQAFILYEDDISDSKEQMELVQVSCATLCTLDKLEPEDYDTLITNTTKHAARLLKKPDQCRAVCLCSHLFWNAGVKYDDERSFHDGKRVLDCLQRALKIADVCMQSGMNVSLFIEILNRYIFYFEARNDKITIKYLQGLLDLVKEHLSAMDASPEADAVRAHYKATVAHVRRMQAEAGDTRFDELQL